MDLPYGREAQFFYRAAIQRLEDAWVLLDKAERTTGAVYLAGYAVECALKALVLAALPAKQRRHMLAFFRGAKAHDHTWLLEKYRKNGGQGFPSYLAKEFARVATWSTELRYQPGFVSLSEAEAFLRASRTIVTWAKRRL